MNFKKLTAFIVSTIMLTSNIILPGMADEVISTESNDTVLSSSAADAQSTGEITEDEDIALIRHLTPKASAEQIMKVNKGAEVRYNNRLNRIKIIPSGEVYKGTKINISIKNGSFDSNLLNECLYSVPKEGSTWDVLIRQLGYGTDDDIRNVLDRTVKAANSNQLPYNIEIIDSQTLSVELFPLPDQFALMKNSDIAAGIPTYYVSLPAIAGNNNGYISVDISTEVPTPGLSDFSDIVIGYTTETDVQIKYELSDNFRPERIINTDSLQPIEYNNEGNRIIYIPDKGIEYGDCIYIHIQNGSFDETLISQCEYTVPKTGETWDTLIEQLGVYYNNDDAIKNTLTRTVKAANSNSMPYKLDYVDSDTLKVQLFPLPEQYVRQESSDIASGKPAYYVELPAVAGSNGFTKIYVEDSKVIDTMFGPYTIANTGNYTEEYIQRDNISAQGIPNAAKNEIVHYKDQLNTINIIPEIGVEKGSIINIKVQNGSFDETLLSQCEYKVPKSGESFDDLMVYLLGGVNYNNIKNALNCVRNANSNEMPYKIQHIDSQTMSVELFPLPTTCANTYSSDVSSGVPIYYIKLPLKAGNADGFVQVAVDGGESTILSSGWHNVAKINTKEDYSANDNFRVYCGLKTVNPIKAIFADCSSLHYNSVFELEDDLATSSQAIEPVSLTFEPYKEVKLEDSFIIRLENGSFYNPYSWILQYHVPYTGETWATLLDQLGINYTEEDIRHVLNRTVKAAASNELPYDIRLINDKEAEIRLFPLPKQYVGTPNSDVAYGYPVYKIALPIVAGTNNGDINLYIDDGGNGTYEPYGPYKVTTVKGSYPITGGNIYFDEQKQEVYGGDASMTSLDIPGTLDGKKVTSVSGFTDSQLKSVTIADGIEKIEAKAFSNSTVTEVRLGNGVKVIGSEAFASCPLNSITIPESVELIEADAFKDCEKFTVYCKEGSYADTWAKERGYDVIYDNPSTNNQKGDLNGDNVIDSRDSLILFKYVAGDNVSIDTSLVDFNHDSIIDSRDSLILFKYVAGDNVALN